MTHGSVEDPTALGGRRTVAMKEMSGGLVYALYADDGRAVAHRPATSESPQGLVAVQGTGPLPLNMWTDIVVTYGGWGALRFFVNGHR